MIYECANVACVLACQVEKHTRLPACDIKNGCVHSVDSPVATKLIHLRKNYSRAQSVTEKRPGACAWESERMGRLKIPSNSYNVNIPWRWVALSVRPATPITLIARIFYFFYFCISLSRKKYAIRMVLCALQATSTSINTWTTWIKS